MPSLTYGRYVLFSATGIHLFAASMLVPIYALFAEEIGASVFQVGLLASTAFAAKFCVVLILRALADSISQPLYLLLLSYLLHGLAWASLLFVTTTTGLFIIQVINGFSYATGAPAYRTLLARHLPRSRAVRMYASWELIKAVTGLVASIIGAGIVAVAGFSVLFQVMVLLSILSFFWLWSMRKMLCS